MTKFLQKRFVLAAMIAITLLLFVMLGAINIWNVISTNNQIEHTLKIIEDNNFTNPPIPPESETNPPAPSQDKDMNLFMAANYFYVVLDADGNTKNIELSKIAVIDETEAEAYAKQAFKKGEEKGCIQNFIYQIRYSPSKNECKIIFLNTSVQKMACIRVLLLSFGIGFVCWALMLILVICLSKKMILPIVENMEKQKQFITNAGHEIKTPLAIILSNTDAMELYNGENKWSKNIRTQVNRLNGLMQNLLFLAKQDEKADVKAAEKINISDIAADSLQYYMEAMKLKNVVITNNIEPNIIINSNKESVIQLFSILLDNASKYVNSSGKFTLTLNEESGKVKIICANTCIPLPEGNLNRFFDRFYREDSARTQKTGGYGIGLSVALNIVNSMHGIISVKTENEQVVFTIII